VRRLRHAIAANAYVTFHVTTGVASGYVDVLRIGEGVQEGGFWGYATDGLRVLSLFGPLAKGARHVRIATRGKVGPLMARFIKQARRVDNCSWIASVKALRMTNVKPFARLSDLIRSANVEGVRTAGQTGRTYLKPLMDGLRKLGAKPKEFSFSHFDDLMLHSARKAKGVFVVSYTWGEQGTHTVVVQGGRIHDTYGQVFKSLADFRARYPNAKLIRNVWGPDHGSQYYIPRATTIATPPGKHLGKLATIGPLTSMLAIELNQLEVAVRFPLGPAPHKQARSPAGTPHTDPRREETDTVRFPEDHVGRKQVPPLVQRQVRYRVRNNLKSGTFTFNGITYHYRYNRATNCIEVRGGGKASVVPFDGYHG
jgi:hypothetical protein